MVSPDDTQPRAPFRVTSQTEPPLIPPPTDDDGQPASGPGCLLLGVVGAVVLGCALLVALMAGAAGWTSGQQIARANATATQGAQITDQLERIPGDIASGNTVMLEARLRFLATLTPGVSGIPELMQTATAVADRLQPTATATASPTPEAPATMPAAEAPAEAPPTIEGGGFDKAALLEQARSAVTLAQYEEGIDLLDALIALDPAYERTTVNALMLEALRSRALILFRTGTNLAEAIVLTDRAEDFGLSGQDDLRFEREVATLYLNARSASGANYGAAVQALQRVLELSPNYLDARQLLFQAHVAQGDFWVAQSEYCPAVGPYTSALNVLSDGGVAAKRTNAETMCAQATPVGLPPGTPLPDGQPVAPVGVPQPPPGG
jgi:hypothetical protein